MSDSTVTAALNPTREVRAATASGYLMLFVWLVLLALALWAGISNGTAEVQVAWKWVVVVLSGIVGTLILCGFYLINPNEAGATAGGVRVVFVWVVLLALALWGGISTGTAEVQVAWKWVVVVLSGIVGTLILCGFYLINPNEAAAIQLFGSYKGTDRETGLRWVLPWLTRKKIAVRANNIISEKIKVNDLRGNPIEMAAQVVWRVTDTAQALFDVDDYKEFVVAQIEAAVRSIGSRYPYDDIEHQEVTLRGNHDEVGGELRKALIERLAVAGRSEEPHV